jgi:hypothetical protein
MEDLHRLADKVDRDLDHLTRVLLSDDTDEDDQLRLALSIAKRVRRDSTLLVRAIAAELETLQPGGTSE